MLENIKQRLRALRPNLHLSRNQAILAIFIVLGLTAAGIVIFSSNEDPYVTPEFTSSPTPEVTMIGRPSVWDLSLYDDHETAADSQYTKWLDTQPADAEQIKKLADTPTARWIVKNTELSTIERIIQESMEQNTAPVFVLYNLPYLNCSYEEPTGADGPADYRNWVNSLVDATAGSPAIFIVEPDAVPIIGCLEDPDQQKRLELINYAVKHLSESNHAVYIDAGHSKWYGDDYDDEYGSLAATGIEILAERLQQAGIGDADGFSLNVSNFQTNEDEVEYGQKLSALLSGAHFVIDTSRNGLGPTDDQVWCNPEGRAIGQQPGAVENVNALDAYLWIKVPGESDGVCNGGPSDGRWWPEYALGLAQRASY